MKRILSILAVALFIAPQAFSQYINRDKTFTITGQQLIGVNPLNAVPPGAWLTIGDSATTKGLIIPRVVTVNSITLPRQGMICYERSSGRFYVRTATAWVRMATPDDVNRNALTGKPTTFLYTDQTYANPAWLTALDASKITNLTAAARAALSGQEGVSYDFSTGVIKAPGKVDSITMRNDSILQWKGAVSKYVGKAGGNGAFDSLRVRLDTLSCIFSSKKLGGSGPDTLYIDLECVKTWLVANGVGSGGSGSGADTAEINTVNVAALQAAPIPTGMKRARTSGYTTIGDDGGADYYWDATSTDNTVFSIRPTAIASGSPGRWRLIIHNSTVGIKQLGAKNDNSTNNRYIIQAAADIMPGGTIRLNGAGVFRIDSTIRIYGKVFTIEGQSGSFYNNTPTILKVDAGRTAIHVTRDNVNAFQKSIFRDFIIQSYGKTTYAHGMYIQSVVEIKNVGVSGFKGDGIRFDANVGAGTDASLSLVERAESSQNDGNGFFMRYGDANQITFLNCDARDNAGVGFYDSSFLGNQFFGCHGNLNGGGHYKVTDINARSTFIGCYGESGSPASDIQGRSIVIGGIHENGVTGSPYMEGGRIQGGFSFPKYDAVSGQDDNLSILEAKMTFNAGGGEVLSFQNQTSGITDYAYNFGSYDYGKGALRFRSGGLITPHINAGGSAPGELSHALSTFAVTARNFYVDGRKLGAVYNDPNTALSSDYYPGTTFKPGDLLLNAKRTPNTPPGWTVLEGGTSGTYSEGRTASNAGGQTVTLNAATAVIKVGDYLTIGGVTAQVQSINEAKTQLTFPVSAGVGSGMAISYGAPKFRAWGSSMGLTIHRPTLSVNDAGYQYWNTDSSKNETWTGSTWTSAAGGGGGGGSYTFTGSLVNTSGSVALVNDQTSPGANHMYATNSSGGKGWIPIPSGGGASAPNKEILYGTGSAATSSPNFTYAGTEGLNMVADVAGATGVWRNSNGAGFSGLQLNKANNTFGAFFGYSNTDNHLRFNTNDGAVVFKTADVNRLIIGASGTINYPGLAGTGTRINLSSSTGDQSALAAGTTGQVLKQGASGPEWGEVTGSGGTATNLAVVANADYTWVTGVTDVIFTGLMAGRTITLPSSPPDNTSITIKNPSATYSITLSLSVYEDEAVTSTTVIPGSFMKIIYDATTAKWWIIAEK